MCYRCGDCGSVVGAGVMMMKRVESVSLSPKGSRIVREVPVCRECKGATEPLSVTKRVQGKVSSRRGGIEPVISQEYRASENEKKDVASQGNGETPTATAKKRERKPKPKLQTPIGIYRPNKKPAQEVKPEEKTPAKKQPRGKAKDKGQPPTTSPQEEN